MSRIIAICGKICSGKSWYARALKERENAVILSTDEATFDLIDNEQGEFYDRFCLRVNGYLRKKAAEIVEAGSNVILDWGFWTTADRKALTEFCKGRNIAVEWHYISISDADWDENIRQRNARISAGSGGSDFFVTPELKAKVTTLFEIPQRGEIDVWVDFGNIKNACRATGAFEY